MSILCRVCGMVTAPTGYKCEFCGKSPFFKNKKEVEEKLKNAKTEKQKNQLQIIIKFY